MANCEICGEPMDEAESMFKYHGFSGACPKPPLPKPMSKVVVEYIQVDLPDEYRLDIHVDRKPYACEHFASEEERQRFLDDLLQSQRSLGAVDLPNKPQ